MMKKKSLASKISTTIIIIVLAVLVLAGAVFSTSMYSSIRFLLDTNDEMAGMSGETSLSYVTYVTKMRMEEMASSKARVADHLFQEFSNSVVMAANAVQKIYDNSEEYSPRPVSLPDPQKDGSLSVQILYSAAADRNDPALKAEADLLGNIQDTLYVINAGSASMASDYFASESGFMIQADYISGKKFDEQGNLLPLEAKERPWYYGAVEKNDLYFTPVTSDLHTGRAGIMCGMPVYSDGELKGVAAAGMYLDDIESIVTSVNLGRTGNAFLLSQDGHLVFSTFKSGMFSMADGQDTNFMESSDRDMSVMANRACSGNSGISLINVDGVDCYIAYAPLETVGWSFLVAITQEEVEDPSHELETALSVISAEAAQRTEKAFQRTILLLIVLLVFVIGAAIWASVILSRRVVEPIIKLTNEVRNIQGDNLDFKWNLDTGDETQTLAETFGSLTTRMKQYIEDTKKNTAYRERINTELKLAAGIQNSALPRNFPAFPDRHEFDLYGLMDPAREVGGDFYDFLMVDDDHLFIAIADVSGKGIPAALLMMSAKIILIQNAKAGYSPARILNHTNIGICQGNSEEMFVTIWCAILELSTGKLTAANAGHEYPLVTNANGDFEVLKDKHGLVVGAMRETRYQEYEVSLKPGDKVLVYTDGVPEANDPQHNLFGMDRLVETVNKIKDGSPESILHGLTETIDDFAAGTEQFDDITMLCLEYKGNQENSEE